jgi:hypothetical protein
VHEQRDEMNRLVKTNERMEQQINELEEVVFKKNTELPVFVEINRKLQGLEVLMREEDTGL